jgi:transposase InsO family protein
LLAGNEKTQSRTPPVGKIYNTVRPHQALGYLPPQQFLRHIASPRKE